MFKIVESSRVPLSKEPVRLGAPDYTYPDLAFITSFSSHLALYMNSIVLRESLLNSAQFLEENLKIRIVDLTKEVVPVKTAPVKKTKPKPVEKPKGPGEVEWK